MNNTFLTTIANRRSYYGLQKDSPLSDHVLQSLIEESVKHTPSAMNAQITRVVILLKEAHDQLWTLTKDALKKVVPEDQFSSTDKKITSFQQAYGTVLFFEDHHVVTSLEEQFPLYKENFSIWAHQENGMAQLIVWSALEAEGYGASLQHYTELIEESVKDYWQIPEAWKLVAQMPFGTPTEKPSEKSFLPIKDRVKLYK